MTLDEAGESALDPLPVGRTQRIDRIPGRIRGLVRQRERAAQDLEILPFGAGWEGVAQPVPTFVEVGGQGHVAEQQVEGGPGVAPAAAGCAEHRV